MRRRINPENLNEDGEVYISREFLAVLTHEEVEYLLGIDKRDEVTRVD